ncbi:MAG: hydroxysqualene dehydroxylase HpnE [Gammaproteobacteria bacterium]|nr:hydroxysqualene dehydroxylase HpnE [Gammaproteobacteria bacterium]
MAATESKIEIKKQRVIIIGGGWAGLAAAVELSRHSEFKVTLYEAARQLGGRARRVPFNEQGVDNGQHLLIGAYKDTLTLIESLGVNLEEKFLRQPLDLTIRSPLKRQTIKLKASRLPAPMHLLMALLSCRGFSLIERIRALQFGTRLFMHGFKFKGDISVAELMYRYRQPKSLVEKFWGPLCIAIMNTPVAQASASVFLRVLHDCFRNHQQDSDLLFAKDNLGKLLPDPATDFIEKNNNTIKLGQRITHLEIDKGKLYGMMIDDQMVDADHIILATSPSACHRLISDQPDLKQLEQQLASYHYQPICTIYLQYPPEVSTGSPMIGILGGYAQWLFDRSIYGQDGLMAVVISSEGPHMELDNEQLIEQISKELSLLYPDWPAPETSMVIREKRATFHCSPDINENRPDNTTPVEGLWLAGDYTNTGYPATLEGAVRSGLECAHQLIDKLKPEQTTG